MEKKILNYIAECEKYNSSDYTNEENIEFLKEMLIRISFFQHERLIHLIVTITFAILTLLSLILCFVAQGISVFVLTILFIVLLIPYIRHYYILENSVQKLYDIYEIIYSEVNHINV